MRSTIDVTEGVEFKCACGGKVIAASKPDPVVIHSEPICDAFEKMDPADFLRVNRERIESGAV